jgi:hypothetical protein
MSNRTLLWLGGAPALLIVLGMVVKRLYPGAEAALTELGIGLLGLLVLGLTGLGHLVERLATPWGLVVLLGLFVFWWTGRVERQLGAMRARLAALEAAHNDEE